MPMKSVTRSEACTHATTVIVVFCGCLRPDNRAGHGHPQPSGNETACTSRTNLQGACNRSYRMSASESGVGSALVFTVPHANETVAHVLAERYRRAPPSITGQSTALF